MRNTAQSVEHNIPQTNQPTAITPQGSRTLTKRKETERSTRFQAKKKLKAVRTKSNAKETDVSINIGFLKVEASGNLKRCRGKTDAASES